MELSLCFLLLILFFTTLSSLRWNSECSKRGWSGLPIIGLFSSCCDSHVKSLMELNAINPWLVRPANELKFSVPVCSSHVKRVLTRSDCADLDANDDFVLLRRCLPDPMWSVLPHVVMEARIACKQQVRGIRQSGYTPSVESIAAASSHFGTRCS